MQPADGIVLENSLRHFAIMIAIGVVPPRRVKNVEDYYMGGRRFGKILMIMFAFGSGTHADTAVGIAAESYKLGMAGIWYQWLQVFNTPFYYLLAAVFRRARCLTTGEFFEMRYGASMGILYGFVGVAINTGFMAVLLFGSSRLVEALTGGAISFGMSMVIMTAAFLFYTLVGGMIATVWNDLFQGILTIVMSFILIPFTLSAVGGIHGFQAKIANVNALFSLVAPGEIGLFWILASAVNQMFSVVAQPHIMSNMAAGKTELDNRIGFATGATLKRICTVAWALVGVLAIGYYGKGATQGDHVFGSLVHDLLPVGFAGLMTACVMASVMNGGAVFVMTTSALLTRNLFRVFKGRPERELAIGRLCSIGYVAASLALANSFSDVPSAIRFLWNLQPLIGISFWLGLWWRRANHYGAWASFLAGTMAWGLGSYGFHWEGDAGLPYLISLRLGVGLCAGVIVSLLTRPAPEELLDRFYLTINTPIGQESRLERFETRSQSSVTAVL